MPSFLLSAIETRVLGCLIEKERHTPENYPLSLHSLTTACNQSTNRDPVFSLDESSVEEAVNALREKRLATVIFGAGSRVQKYRHKLLEHYELNERDVAILCILLLRGPQTPGELRVRTERMHSFGSVEAVDQSLEELARGESPLVQVLSARPGQKERRYVQLFSAEIPAETSASSVAPTPSSPTSTRIDSLEKEAANLRAELGELRSEFAAFRKQFE